MLRSVRMSGGIQTLKHITVQKELDRFRFIPRSKHTGGFQPVVIEIPCEQRFHNEFMAQVWQRAEVRDVVSFGLVCPMLDHSPSPFYLMTCKLRGLRHYHDAAAHVGGKLCKDFLYMFPEHSLYVYTNHQPTTKV